MNLIDYQLPSDPRALLPEFRVVPNFPKPGIDFFDFVPIPKGYRNQCNFCHNVADRVIAPLTDRFGTLSSLKVLALESRGFLLGTLLSHYYDVPLLLARKPHKLPPPTYSATYYKEYGPDSLEVRTTDFTPNDTVLIVDDILATGGTASAVARLLHDSFHIPYRNIGFAFLGTIEALNGRSQLPPESPIYSSLSL